MNKNYYWRARIFSATDSSAWSNYRMIAVHYKMDNSSPFNTSTGSITPVKVTAWHLDSPVQYVYKFDTTSLFDSENLIFRSAFSNSFLDSVYFKFGRKIYWQVTAIDAEGDSLQWSNAYSYTFYTTPITSSTSANGASVVLGWGNTLSANTVLQLDISNTFNSTNLIEKTIKPGTVFDTNYHLLFGKTYYYRIKAVFKVMNTTKRIIILATVFIIIHLLYYCKKQFYSKNIVVQHAILRIEQAKLNFHYNLSRPNEKKNHEQGIGRISSDKQGTGLRAINALRWQ